MWASILMWGIPSIVAIITVVYFTVEWYEFMEGMMMGMLIWIALFLFCALIIAVPGSVVADNIDNCVITPEDCWTQEIRAMKDNTSIDGAAAGGIFYRAGYVDEELYYYYLYDTEKGIAQDKVEADETYIVLADVETATLTKNEYEVKSGFYEGWEGPVEYILTLPLDAEVIENEYTVDLE